MPEIKRTGNEVTLRMSYEAYRDLTESLTAAGNEAWRHARYASGGVSKHIRESHAESAWRWSKAIGIPPLRDGEKKTFELEPFEHLTSVPNRIESEEPIRGWRNAGR